jgi:hypothetical protein
VRSASVSGRGGVGATSWSVRRGREDGGAASASMVGGEGAAVGDPVKPTCILDSQASVSWHGRLSPTTCVIRLGKTLRGDWAVVTTHVKIICWRETVDLLFSERKVINEQYYNITKSTLSKFDDQT